MLPVGLSAACKEKHLLIKGVIELSSCDKLRNFDHAVKMMAVAPHLFDLSLYELFARGEYDISIRCGLLSYPLQRQCEGLSQG